MRQCASEAKDTASLDELAARKLVEIANGIEPAQEGRIFIEVINDAFLKTGGTPDQFRLGIERAVALGWLWRHDSDTFVKFTGSGAALFA